MRISVVRDQFYLCACCLLFILSKTIYYQEAFLRKIGAYPSAPKTPAQPKKAAPTKTPAPAPAPAPVEDDPRMVLIEGLEPNISELDLADVFSNVGKVHCRCQRQHFVVFTHACTLNRF